MNKNENPSPPNNVTANKMRYVRLELDGKSFDIPDPKGKWRQLLISNPDFTKKWANSFIQHPRWAEVFSDSPEAAELFTNHPRWGDFFFPHEGWIDVFKDKDSSKELVEYLKKLMGYLKESIKNFDDDQMWLKLEEWLTLEAWVKPDESQKFGEWLKLVEREAKLEERLKLERGIKPEERQKLEKKLEEKVKLVEDLKLAREAKSEEWLKLEKELMEKLKLEGEVKSEEWLKLAEWLKLLASRPEWGKIFIAHRKWIETEICLNSPRSAKLFIKHPRWGEFFFPHEGWIYVFKDNSEKLIEYLDKLMEYTEKFIGYFDDDQAWSESIKHEGWLKLLANRPGWARLFLRKPEWFERFDKELEWSKQLADDEEWSRLTNDEEWSNLFANDIEWRRLFVTSPKWILVSTKELKEISEYRDRIKKTGHNKTGLKLEGKLFAIPDPEGRWQRLLDSKPDFKKTITQQWANSFTQHPRWAEVFLGSPEAIELIKFFLKYPKWGDFFFPHERWIDVFKDKEISKILIEYLEKLMEYCDDDQACHKSLENKRWLELFPIELEWAKQLPSDIEWDKLSAAQPEWWAIVKWGKLFTELEWQLLIFKKTNLIKKLIQQPQLAEIFIKHPNRSSWAEVFLDSPEATKLFEEHPIWGEFFFPHEGWIDVFKDKEISKKLVEFLEKLMEYLEKSIKNFDSQTWHELLENKRLKLDGEVKSEEWLKLAEWLILLASKPDWAKLFKSKPEWFERFVEDLELAKKLADDTERNELSAHHLVWTLVSADELPRINRRRDQTSKPDINKMRDTPLELEGKSFDIPDPKGKWQQLCDFKPDLIQEFKKPRWASVFFEHSGWAEVFLDSSEASELFLRKPKCFNPLADDPEWAWQLENDEEWKELFVEHPEWAIVSAVERKEISKRRSRISEFQYPNEKSNNNKNLVGLALSGGGIRSASFGLGVLEALKELNLLEQIDYLSTVSGGGYIGAWLSANCKRAPEDGRPSWLKKDTGWEKSIEHLIKYSNYLSPEVGFFSLDTWTMWAVWIRNSLLIQLVVILGIAAFLSLLPFFLFLIFELWSIAGNWRLIVVFFFIMGVAGIAEQNLQLNQLNKGKRPYEDKVSKDGDSWRLELEIALICLMTARVLFFQFKFDPVFHEVDLNIPRTLIVDAITALLLLIGGFYFYRVIDNSTTFKNKINYILKSVPWLIVLPPVIVSFFMALTFYEQTELGLINNWSSFGDYFTKAWKYLPFLLIVVMMSPFLFSFSCVKNLDDLKQKSRDRKVTKQLREKVIKQLREKEFVVFLLAPILTMFLLYIFFVGIMLLLHEWPLHDRLYEGLLYDWLFNEERTQEWIFYEWMYDWVPYDWLNLQVESERELLTFVWIPPLVLLAFSLAIIMLLGTLGRDTSEDNREWWSRLGAWLAMCGLGWIIAMSAAIYSPQIVDALKGWQLQGIFVWLGIAVIGAYAGNSIATKGSFTNKVSTSALEMIARIAPFAFIVGLLVVVSTVLNAIVVNISQSYCPRYWPDDGWAMTTLESLNHVPRHWIELRSICETSPVVALIVGLLCLIGCLLLGWRVDINEFSLNAFYRNRLVRCYLGATRQQTERKPHIFTGFDDKDDIPLSALKNSDGPLHIINCTLNLRGSKDLRLHTRHGWIYTLTPFYCGSGYKFQCEASPNGEAEIGYTPTKNLSGEFGQPLTLGQAIALSGAAANPNRGYHTSSGTALLMTLFNARLGGWLPNPYIPNVETPSPWFGLLYLLKELFGSADERSKYLSISDGGHFENLAAYALIKRKCKVIIISDAEHDPELKFEGLGTLIRQCEIDFGAKIDIDISSIQTDSESSWSRNRYSAGRIIYKDNSEGVLIYIKASMNGNEGTSIKQYKLAHPNFPHDTTADQFYEEDQLESYRNLGYEITKETFKRARQISEYRTDWKSEHNLSSEVEESQSCIIEYATTLKDMFVPPSKD